MPWPRRWGDWSMPAFRVLNQAVLLRGVNDDADVLAELCERLVDLRVMPYYLHQLDRVAGAAHFEVPIERGRELMAELQQPAARLRRAALRARNCRVRMHKVRVD